MANLEQKIQAQKDKIKKGGWKKWGAYLALAAFLLMAVSVTLFKSYFLRKRLAEAKTDAAIAKEELIQDGVDDKIRDLATSNQNLNADITKLDKQLDALKMNDSLSNVKHVKNLGTIYTLKDWDDIDTRVKWDEDDDND